MPGSGAVSESNEKSPEEFSIYDMPKILREEKWPKDLPTEIKKFVERLPGNSEMCLKCTSILHAMLEIWWAFPGTSWPPRMQKVDKASEHGHSKAEIEFLPTHDHLNGEENRSESADQAGVALSEGARQASVDTVLPPPPTALLDQGYRLVPHDWLESIDETAAVSERASDIPAESPEDSEPVNIEAEAEAEAEADVPKANEGDQSTERTKEWQRSAMTIADDLIRNAMLLWRQLDESTDEQLPETQKGDSEVLKSMTGHDRVETQAKEHSKKLDPDVKEALKRLVEAEKCRYNLRCILHEKVCPKSKEPFSMSPSGQPMQLPCRCGGAVSYKGMQQLVEEGEVPCPVAPESCGVRSYNIEDFNLLEGTFQKILYEQLGQSSAEEQKDVKAVFTGKKREELKEVPSQEFLTRVGKLLLEEDDMKVHNRASQVVSEDRCVHDAADHGEFRTDTFILKNDPEGLLTRVKDRNPSPQDTKRGLVHITGDVQHRFLKAGNSTVNQGEKLPPDVETCEVHTQGDKCMNEEGQDEDAVFEADPSPVTDSSTVEPLQTVETVPTVGEFQAVPAAEAVPVVSLSPFESRTSQSVLDSPAADILYASTPNIRSKRAQSERRATEVQRLCTPIGGDCLLQGVVTPAVEPAVECSEPSQPQESFDPASQPTQPSESSEPATQPVSPQPTVSTEQETQPTRRQPPPRSSASAMESAQQPSDEQESTPFRTTDISAADARVSVSVPKQKLMHATGSMERSNDVKHAAVLSEESISEQPLHRPIGTEPSLRPWHTTVSQPMMQDPQVRDAGPTSHSVTQMQDQPVMQHPQATQSEEAQPETPSDLVKHASAQPEDSLSEHHLPHKSPIGVQVVSNESLLPWYTTEPVFQSSQGLPVSQSAEEQVEMPSDAKQNATQWCCSDTQCPSVHTQCEPAHIGPVSSKVSPSVEVKESSAPPLPPRLAAEASVAGYDSTGGVQQTRNLDEDAQEPQDLNKFEVQDAAANLPIEHHVEHLSEHAMQSPAEVIATQPMQHPTNHAEPQLQLATSAYRAALVPFEATDKSLSTLHPKATDAAEQLQQYQPQCYTHSPQHSPGSTQPMQQKPQHPRDAPIRSPGATQRVFHAANMVESLRDPCASAPMLRPHETAHPYIPSPSTTQSVFEYKCTSEPVMRSPLAIPADLEEQSVSQPLQQSPAASELGTQSPGSSAPVKRSTSLICGASARLRGSYGRASVVQHQSYPGMHDRPPAAGRMQSSIYRYSGDLRLSGGNLGPSQGDNYTVPEGQVAMFREPSSEQSTISTGSMTFRTPENSFQRGHPVVCNAPQSSGYHLATSAELLLQSQQCLPEEPEEEPVYCTHYGRYMDEGAHTRGVRAPTLPVRSTFSEHSPFASFHKSTQGAPKDGSSSSSLPSAKSTLGQKSQPEVRRFALLIVNTAYEESIECSYGALPDGLTADVRRLSDELHRRGFDLQIGLDLTGEAIEQRVHAFVQACTKRQESFSSSSSGGISRSGQDEMTLLFYAGHGCIQNRKPCAIGVDGTPTSLYSSYVQALNQPSTKSSTLSIVLLMDSSLTAQSSDPQTTPVQPELPFSEAQDTGNLVVCAHACQPGHHALLNAQGGSQWTSALIKAMQKQDTLQSILLHTSHYLKKHKEDVQVQQPWVVWNRKASTVECCLARPAGSSAALDSSAAESLMWLAARGNHEPPPHDQPITEHQRYIREQLDYVGKELTVYNSYFLNGADDGNRILGSSSVIQTASNRYGEPVVLKLFNCIQPHSSTKSTFATECEAYSKLREHLRSHKAGKTHKVGRSTPSVPLMLVSIVENSSGQHRDLFGQRLPQCLVLKYGEPLHVRMAESRLDVFEVLKVVHDVATVLEHVHSAGLAHRQVQPTHIVQHPETQTWTLIDFSSAAPLGYSVPLVEVSKSSLAYAAPEVAEAVYTSRSCQIVTPGMDAWALGVVAYEMLTGKQWATGLDDFTIEQTLLGILGYKLPWEKPSEQPVPLIHLIASLLHRDPYKRPTMSSFRNACSSGVASLLPPPDGLPQPPNRHTSSSQQRLEDAQRASAAAAQWIGSGTLGDKEPRPLDWSRKSPTLGSVLSSLDKQMTYSASSLPLGGAFDTTSGEEPGYGSGGHVQDAYNSSEPSFRFSGAQVATAARQYESEAPKRFALVIGIKDYEASKSEGRSGYSDLDMQVIDASRTDRALKLRGFEVQLCVDGSAKDVTEHLNRFVEHFKKRNAAHKEATQHAIAQGMDADESSSMQQDEILVVYFAGHGVLGDQHELLAVGKDGETIDLNDSFLKAADEVDSQAGNSLVLLMDVCLDERYAADHKAAWDEERVPGYNINERKNSNLKICVHACLSGPVSRMGGVWTRALLNCLRNSENDLVRMLEHIEKDPVVKRVRQEPRYRVVEGVHLTCDLARPGHPASAFNSASEPSPGNEIEARKHSQQLVASPCGALSSYISRTSRGTLDDEKALLLAGLSRASKPLSSASDQLKTCPSCGESVRASDTTFFAQQLAKFKNTWLPKDFHVNRSWLRSMLCPLVCAGRQHSGVSGALRKHSMSQTSRELSRQPSAPQTPPLSRKKKAKEAIKRRLRNSQPSDDVRSDGSSKPDKSSLCAESTLAGSSVYR